MVRFLLYANEFEVEALIASAATFAGVANKQNIIDMIELYGKSYEKLVEFDPDYPTVSQLIEVTYQRNHSTWGNFISNLMNGKRFFEKWFGTSRCYRSAASERISICTG